MKKLILIAATIIGLSSSMLADPAYARERYSPTARPISYCLLRVRGKTIINGPCVLYMEKDGSFQIDKGRWFAIINKNDNGTAELSWNDSGGYPESHANADPSLGMLVRDGECWSNNNAKVCARK